MRTFFHGWAAALVVGSLTLAAGADPQTDELKAKMVKAYKDLPTYQAATHFERKQQVGRWTMTQSTDYRIALDRSDGKLMVDNPNILLVSDGNKLRVKSDQVPGRHLELDAPKPLNYDNLNKAVPFVNRPPMADLMLALAEDPVAALSEGKQAEIKALPPESGDAQKRPRLQVSWAEGKITLWLDPASSLVTFATLESRGDAAPAPGEEPEPPSQVSYQINIQKSGQPLDAATFAFDTTGSTAIDSVQDYIGGGGERSALEGKAAPALELKALDGSDYKLADEKAQVVVLDFWATWCPPCRKGLPEIQKVADWAKAQNKPVAFYAINVRETSAQVKEFWTKAQLTMPVLLDAESKVADAYGVEALPMTVIINKGKVVHVITGLAPNEEELLKGHIEELLKAEK